MEKTRSGVAAPTSRDSGCKEAAAGTRRDLPGVTAPDPLTVAIQLTHPRGYFSVSSPIRRDGSLREAIEKNGGVLDEKAAVGTGPFSWLATGMDTDLY